MRTALIALTAALPPAAAKVTAFEASPGCRALLRDCVARAPLTCSVVCSNDRPSAQIIDRAGQDPAVLVPQPVALDNEPPVERFGALAHQTQGVEREGGATASVGDVGATAGVSAMAGGVTATSAVPATALSYAALNATTSVAASLLKGFVLTDHLATDVEAPAPADVAAAMAAPPATHPMLGKSVAGDMLYGISSLDKNPRGPSLPGLNAEPGTTGSSSGWFGRRLQERTLQLPYLQAVGEVLANRETDTDHMTVLRTENAGGEEVIGLRNSTDATAVCENVCVDRRLQECVLANVCQERLTFVESWNVTHFCVANNGTMGGWAFRLPLSVALNSTNVDLVEVRTEIFPATERVHTVQSATVELTMSLASDGAPQYDDSMLRHCAIESLVGVPVSAQVSATGAEDGSSMLELSAKVPAWTAAQVQANSANDTQFSGLLEGEKLLLALTAPSGVLANGGPLPPPLDRTQVTIKHHLW